MEILLANPRGFCAGVDRAVAIVERALALFGAPVYVRHEVVHNRFVVDALRAKGVVFVESLDEAPDGALVVFSAHGVSAAVKAEAARRKLHALDATCPLVTKVHLEVIRHNRAGREVVLIGHRGHPEVVGTMGQYDAAHGGRIHLVESVEDAQNLQVDTPDKLAFVTQTTLSVDDTREIVQTLKRRFPALTGPRKDDICYATQNRQDAVKALVEVCNPILIIGSVSSSNSNRLREIATKRGIDAYLVDDPAGLRDEWFAGRRRIGVSAGASAPESLVKSIVREMLRRYPISRVREQKGVAEKVVFNLPRELREITAKTTARPA